MNAAGMGAMDYRVCAQNRLEQTARTCPFAGVVDGRGTGQSFLTRAFRDRVPIGGVGARCRNWGVLHGRAMDIAEEAAAEAYCRVLGRSFGSEDHFRAWLTRIAMNIAVDLLRASRTRSASSLAAMAAPMPASDLDTADLAECLGKLAEEEQRILRMTFEEKLTLDQIADQILPPNEGTANARRLRIKRRRELALRRLRCYL